MAKTVDARDLRKGDVWDFYGRRFVVGSEPVTERGITRWRSLSVSGKDLGEASSLALEPVKVIRRGVAVR